jgi:hypothetical protein
MTNYTYVASYDVRKALLNELQDKNLIDLNDYVADGFSDPLEPVIPAQQVPEFNNLLPGKTYIVYDVVQNNIGPQWWLTEETITFDIVSTDSAEIQTFINVAIDLFRRYDLSAKEITIDVVSTSPFSYHYFRVDLADSVQPFVNEGGSMNGVISVTYAYTREVDYLTGRYK